jgi:hypothetical protein
MATSLCIYAHTVDRRKRMARLKMVQMMLTEQTEAGKGAADAEPMWAGVIASGVIARVVIAPLLDTTSVLVLNVSRRKEMVDPIGLEPTTSSVSRKRSNQTELRV